MFDLDKREFLVSRDVVFYETEFPLASSPLTSVNSRPPLLTGSDSDWLFEPAPTAIERGSSSLNIEDDNTRVDDSTAVPLHEQIISDSSPVETIEPIEPSNSPATVPITHEEVLDEPVVEEVVLGRGQRNRAPPVKFQDCVNYCLTCDEDTHLAPHVASSESSQTISGMTPYPLAEYILDHAFSPSHQAFLAAATSDVTPKRYHEAARDRIWRDAMKLEVTAHEDQGTWDIATLPPGKVAIRSQWVDKWKYNADGTKERPKARLVANGNKQLEGEDFDETFAPVVKMATV